MSKNTATALPVRDWSIHTDKEHELLVECTHASMAEAAKNVKAVMTERVINKGVFVLKLKGVFLDDFRDVFGGEDALIEHFPVQAGKAVKRSGFAVVRNANNHPDYALGKTIL